jgi:glycosyltransferase involved in cell wall biosynthesis
MKICIVGEFSGNLDEGMRNTSFHFAEELSRRNSVLRLEVRDAFTFSFWKQIRHFHPQIIHYVHGPSIKSFILLKLLSFFTGSSKTVISALHPEVSPSSKLYMGILKPDIILTLSLLDENKFNDSGCKTQFFPLGIDTSKFVPFSQEIKYKLRQKYSIDKDDYVLLHIGSIHKERGLSILEHLGDNNRIIVVGSTSTGVEPLLKKDLENSGCLVWIRYFEKIEEIYNLADCYVFPVKDSTGSIALPLSVLEAMSCNLPVITTRFGALPRLFEKGEGLYFADSPEDFIERLQEIKQGIKINTREKVLHYSWENISIELEKVYSDLINPSRGK